MWRKMGLLVLVTSAAMGGCGSYPRLLNFPQDNFGRSLNSSWSELTPSVSGRYITFASDRNGSQSIYLYDIYTRRLIDLPGLNALNVIASHPTVSEDGRYVVFAASSQGKSGIYLYDRDTQQKRNLTTNLEGEVRRPSISADGTRIAFEVAKDGQWDIWVSDRTGKVLNFP